MSVPSCSLKSGQSSWEREGWDKVHLFLCIWFLCISPSASLWLSLGTQVSAGHPEMHHMGPLPSAGK